MIKLLKSILAGIAISIGGAAYLSAENSALGAFLFALGLFTIYTFDFYLYTGRLCSIPDEGPKYLLTVLFVFIGNAIGTISTGYLLRLTKFSMHIKHATQVVDPKLADGLFSSFIVAIFCGFLMCIAVLGFKTIKNDVGKHLSLFMPIMVFILCGFEHSIADMFYFSFAGAWDTNALIHIIVIALGNLVGGIIIPLMRNLETKLNTNSLKKQ